MSKRVRQHGFSYLEILTAVAIAALLAAVAIPSYMTAVRKNNRTDAFSALAKIASGQELFFNNQAAPRSYTDDFGDLGMGTVSVGGHYDLSVVACAGSTLAQCYVARATARSASTQYKDTGCTTLTLDTRGRKGSSPAADGCWRE
jgi:type IV pilus assembly protein PilE